MDWRDVGLLVTIPLILMTGGHERDYPFSHHHTSGNLECGVREKREEFNQATTIFSITISATSNEYDNNNREAQITEEFPV